MQRQVQDMVEAILPAGGEPPPAGDEDDGEAAAHAEPVCRADLDERILEFLGTVPTAIAEAALREAKALDMDGIRNRAAYLMGVLKRKVADADQARHAKRQQQQQRGGQGGGRGGTKKRLDDDE